MKKHIEPNVSAYLAATLATEPKCLNGSAYACARDAELLIRLGKRAARISVQKCNGIDRYDAKARMVLASWTEADEARAEKALAKIAAEANVILATYGATDLHLHGDPRGHVMTFTLASGRSNSFGGNWGV